MRSDTSPDMQDKYRKLLMALSPGERVIKCCGMFNAAKALAVAGLEDEENPDGLSLKARLFLCLYRDDFSREDRDRIVATLDRDQ